MFDNVFELPSDVRSSLSADDCKVWMDTYNNGDHSSPESVKDSVKKAWRACSKLPSSFSFEIVASTDTVDRANDRIDLDSIKKTMDSYIDFGGNVQLDHRNYTVGHIWDWEPADIDTEEGKVPGIIAYGNLFGGDFVYDTVRKHFVDGMNSLSIGGEATHGNYQCDEKGCYTKKDLKQLLEISVCSSPMNKYSNMIWYNKGASLTKSADDRTFKLRSYTIHKSEAECPLLSLRRALRDIGYDAHAKEDGVYVPMTRSMYDMHHSIFGDHGIVSCYHNGNAILSWKDDAERIMKGSSAPLLDRLKETLNKDGKITIAVDFDNTILDNPGGPDYKLIDLLKRCSPFADIFVWTCRGDDDKQFIEGKMKQFGVNIVGVNETPDENKSSRKAYADVYLDDRAGLEEVRDILSELCDSFN